MNTITREEIVSLLQKNKSRFMAFGVKRIGLFGSFQTNSQSVDSDVDLLVDFAKGKKTFQNFIHTAETAEDLLGRPVDLVTMRSLSPYIKPHIAKQANYVQISS